MIWVVLQVGPAETYRHHIGTGLIMIGAIDTLASMLGRTTSLLPNALFASLGMPRDENITDVCLVSAQFALSPHGHTLKIRIRGSG